MRPSMEIIHTKDEGFVKTYLSGFIRAWVVAAILLFQFALIFVLAFFLSRYGLYIYLGIDLIVVIIICGLINKRTDECFKIGWLIIIAVLPIAGALMYLLWGRASSVRKIRRRHLKLLKEGAACVPQEAENLEAFAASYPQMEGLAQMLSKEGFPIYANNSMKFYGSGEEAFAAVIEDFKAACEYILMSFFIVADGALWKEIKPILIEKASKGVKIKFLYDDFGSMLRTDSKFWKELTDAGIEVASFNPVHKYLDKLYKNFRSHQKIIVVDGKVGYTGGFNLADEYINAVERFGYWKDNGIRIEGDAAFGLAAIFLEMWGLTTGAAVTDISDYRRSTDVSNAVYCQPFADGPDDIDSSPIPSAIRYLISRADKYLYITTPYLVVGDEIVNCLIDARKRGVDVRIVTPFIPDKKFVFQLTRLGYGRLLANGVRIYEYTPGFIHAKSYVSESCCMLGTVNLDYRSLYLHYECETALWDKQIIDDVRSDIEKTFTESNEITYEMWKNRPFKDRVIQQFLSLFASLL